MDILDLITNKKLKFIHIFLISIILFIVSIIFARYLDLFWLFVIISICLLIFLYSKKSRHRLLLRLVSVFILLHSVIFPLIYVIEINLDNNSFEFDQTISKLEIINSQEKLIADYEPQVMQKKLAIIDDILKTNNLNIDSIIITSDNAGLIIVNKYHFQVMGEQIQGADPGITRPILQAYDDKGKPIIKFYSPYAPIDNYKVSLKSYMLRQKNDIDKRKIEFKREYESLKNLKNVFNYRTILPYTLNITFADSIKPKTKIANFTYFIHNIIVITFILGFLINLSMDVIARNKK